MGVGKIVRRTFLGVGAAAIAGVAYGYYVYQRPFDNPLRADTQDGEAVFNPYLTITEDGQITIITPRAEMGQGIHTTLAALVAEELDIDLSDVNVIHGPPSYTYYNAAMLVEGAMAPFFDRGVMAEIERSAMRVVSKYLALQVTGGSSSTVDGFVKMREAGATARASLIAAAAARWDVAADTLETISGTVRNPATGEVLSYGALALAAAEVAPPDVSLKPKSEWRILGRSTSRVEIADKVTGGRIFGIDVQLPDMLYGTIKMSPRFGAEAVSYNDSAALSVPGVRAVIPIQTTTGSGFGIIADNTWAAFQGADALDVTWGDAPYPEGDDGIRDRLVTAIEAEPSTGLRSDGDVEAAFAEAPEAEVIEAEYSVPYLAHATMEPMNATAQFADGRLTLWTGTQAPGLLQITAGDLLGIETDAVDVITTHLGGGFGRRGEVDYPLYAAALAREADGRPIKVTWTREEDTRHDTYRPAALGRFRAHVPAGGPATAIDMRIAAPSIMKSVTARTFPQYASYVAGPDKTITDGAYNQPYMAPHYQVTGHEADISIPVGFWRAVGNSYNGFFHESFMDEMAEKAGADPLSFRLSMMQADEFAPARAVLNRVAELSNWGAPLPDGTGKGIAHVLSFGTWTAMVVQVSQTDSRIKIDHVWTVADPGEVLDPDNFKAQISSAAIYAFSSCIGEEITFADGEVQQSNFPDYPMLTLSQTPRFETEFLTNSHHLGGAGEVGTPPAIPALANAIYAAMGTRLRQMPFSRDVDFAF